MSMTTNVFRLSIRLGIVLLVCFSLPTAAQEAEAEVTDAGYLVGSMPNDPLIQSEIDNLLGMTESKIKQGIVNPGVDLANLAVNRALDEMIKALASSVVLAPVAEKIMSIYQKTKDKRLVKKLASLRAVWKDGQERINKLQYQNFKLRYEWAKTHNEEGKSLQESSIKTMAKSSTKEIYGSQIQAINQTYDQGPISKLVERYLDKNGENTTFFNLAIIMGELNEGKVYKDRVAFLEQKGKGVFLSPYERLKLQQKQLKEAKQRHGDLANLGNRVAAPVRYYQMAEAEQALRSGLSKRAVDPYMVRYNPKK